MDPILDETSLEPSPYLSPSKRITLLAHTLRDLDKLGLPRVLRSVKNLNREIGCGKGFLTWCHDSSVDIDSRRMVGNRLAKSPYIDGNDGLLVQSGGGNTIIAGEVNGKEVFGLALAALMNGFVVLLEFQQKSSVPTSPETVMLTIVEGQNCSTKPVEVFRIANTHDVEYHRDWIKERNFNEISTGFLLIERAPEIFPNIRFGSLAIEQIRNLNGSERYFEQVLKHLDKLDKDIETWRQGTRFSPTVLSCSEESTSTLSNRKYRNMRKFPAPEGYSVPVWSLHTKPTGGNVRLYFHPSRSERGNVVLVGYLGPHLPTSNFRT